MGLHTDDKGRLHTHCPNCQALKLVRKNAKNVTHPKFRMRCAGCGTSWIVAKDDHETIKKAYGMTEKTRANSNTSSKRQDEPGGEEGGRSLGALLFGGGKK